MRAIRCLQGLIQRCELLFIAEGPVHQPSMLCLLSHNSSPSLFCLILPSLFHQACVFQADLPSISCFLSGFGFARDCCPSSIHAAGLSPRFPGALCRKHPSITFNLISGANCINALGYMNPLGRQALSFFRSSCWSCFRASCRSAH